MEQLILLTSLVFFEHFIFDEKMQLGGTNLLSAIEAICFYLLTPMVDFSFLCFTLLGRATLWLICHIFFFKI